MSTIHEIKNSYGKYYLAMNPDYKYYEYQQNRIVPKFEALERGDINRLAVFMSPGDSKSDLSTRNFMPWFMGRHPDKNAMVTSYSAELASDDFGAKIKKRMSNPLHLKIFPDSRLTQDSRSKTHFTTIRDGHFYSVGYEGGITGKRVDLFGIDDWIKNWEEAESEATQTKLFETYTGVVKDRLKPGAKIFMCTHRWTQQDVYKRIIDQEGTVEEGGDWTVLKLPAEDPPGSGTYLWEEYHGKKHYEDFKKKNDKIWWSKFQQDPSASQDFWFKKQNLNFYEICPRPGKFKAYLFCDPGASKDRKSDRTSTMVLCAAQDKKLLLVDWVLDRLHPGERQKMLERMIRRWNPEINIYEEYGLVNDAWYFNKAAEESDFNAVLTPVGKRGPRHNLSKEQRIDGLRPWFDEGRIFLPRKFEYKMTNGQTVDLTKRFIDDEYSLYKGKGSVAHDDDLDCLSRINEPEVNFEYYIPEHERPKRQVSGHVGSWQSLY